MLSSLRFDRLLIAVVVASAMWGTSLAAPATAQASVCNHPGHSRIRHVVVIAFENHDYSQVLGRHAPASYFKQLAGQCGSAARFYAAHFPRSLPSYIAATSGKVTIIGDCTPSPGCQTSSQNIFSQLGPRNWRAWAESMPGRCIAQNAGNYVPRHVPAIYYTRIPKRVCHANMLPLPKTPPTPHRKFTWVAPNLIHDMHDGSLAQASAWLHTFLAGRRGLLRSPAYRAGHTAIFVWFDTGPGSSTVKTPIPLIVVSRHAPHHVFARTITNYQLLRGWEGILHLPCINQACGAGGLQRWFHL